MSSPSAIPSQGQKQELSKPTNSPIVQVTVQQPPKAHPLIDFVPSISSAIVAIAVAVMVHRLTRRRERDKSVFELHRNLIDTAKEVRAAANSGWTVASRTKREAAVAEARWQLQRVGAQANLLWKQSKISSVIFWEHSIFLRVEMAAFRDAITLDDFADSTRKQRPSEVTNVERAMGDFIDAVDAELLGWVDRSNRRVKPTFVELWQSIRMKSGDTWATIKEILKRPPS